MASPSCFLKDLVAPPYRHLPLAVFTFFVACFLIYSTSVFHTGQLNDPDDYMRLDQVINWLSGQGWFDTSQPRLSPGADTIIHWSRLVDLPIALFMLPFIHCCGLQGAALVASLIVPLILFSILLMLVPALARNLVGPDHANLSCLLLLFAPMVLFNFSPGRVDHHAYQILIAGFGLLCQQRLVTNANAWLYAVFAAVAFACGLWIGTEAMPWLLLFIACLGFMGAWHGNYILRHMVVFGATLAAATLLILPLAIAPAHYTDLALSWFSSADVIFAVLTAFVFIVTGVLGQQTQNRFLRLGLFLAAGCYATLTFVWLVPETLNGPFASYAAFNATTALDNINEARPLWHALWIDPYNHLTYWRALSTFIHMLALPLAALAAITWNILSTKKHERDVWVISGVFLLTAFLLTLFWQVRVGYFMQIFAVAPLTWLLVTSWYHLALKGRPRFWAEVGIFTALGPLCVLLIPAMFEETKFYPDLVLFTAARSEISCPMKTASAYLNQRYHGKDITIMSGMNEGPEMMFRTPFKLIGGNYNVPGNEDVYNFFNAHDDKTAQNLLHKWHASLVLTCRNIAPFLAGMEHPHIGQNLFLKPGTDGKLHLMGNPKHAALLEKLVNGSAPNWLKPIEIPGDKDYFLFEVKPGH